jgi:hypothetical protein
MIIRGVVYLRRVSVIGTMGSLTVHVRFHVLFQIFFLISEARSCRRHLSQQPVLDLSLLHPLVDLLAYLFDIL